MATLVPSMPRYVVGAHHHDGLTTVCSSFAISRPSASAVRSTHLARPGNQANSRITSSVSWKLRIVAARPTTRVPKHGRGGASHSGTRCSDSRLARVSTLRAPSGKCWGVGLCSALSFRRNIERCGPVVEDVRIESTSNIPRCGRNGLGYFSSQSCCAPLEQTC